MRPAQPADLTPEERFHELTQLLALGLSRLGRHRQHAAISGADPTARESAEILASALELQANKSVTVHTG
jgi:hypothetical protein